MALERLMTRDEAKDIMLAAKKETGVTFQEIASAVGRDKVWVTAALMGQGTMDEAEAEKAVSAVGLGEGEASQKSPPRVPSTPRCRWTRSSTGSTRSRRSTAPR